jgi:hypothetical protein
MWFSLLWYAGAIRDIYIKSGVITALDVWKISAPSFDMISPDVYINEYMYSSSCAIHRHREQPLLIPEQRRDKYGLLSEAISALVPLHSASKLLNRTAIRSKNITGSQGRFQADLASKA